MSVLHVGCAKCDSAAKAAVRGTRHGRVGGGEMGRRGEASAESERERERAAHLRP